MKKIKILNISIILLTFVLLPLKVLYASGFEVGNGTIDLKPIEIPLFSSSALDFVQNASIISWLSFAGGVFTILIIAFWIIRILISGVAALRSEGDQTKLQESYAKLKSNFAGMFITFLIPLILSLIGAFFGIGSIFNWPESFQICENPEYRFYFEAYIKNGDRDSAYSACGISRT